MHRLRRFLVLNALAFSFGGFLFYAGVVVPIGTEVLGSTTQGFVTRLVTNVLNQSSLICVCAVLWDAVAGRRERSPLVTRWLLGLVGVIFFCSCALWGLHAQLDRLVDAEQLAVLEPKSFYGLHRIYLWTSTVQWLCSLPVLWIIGNTGMVSPKAALHATPPVDAVS